jgi:hypothetical protein
MMMRCLAQLISPTVVGVFGCRGTRHRTGACARDSERKTLDSGKLHLKIRSQALNHGLAPGIALLPLDDHAADVPVQGDEFLVHGAQGGVVGMLNVLLHVNVKRRGMGEDKGDGNRAVNGLRRPVQAPRRRAAPTLRAE